MKIKRLIQILSLGAVLSLAASCVYVDQTLGNNFIPKDQKYEVSVQKLPLSGNVLWLEACDSLSCYSNSRITIGSIRDEYGLTKRSSAFTVLPIPGYDTIDVGTNTRIRGFHFTFAKDTIAYNSDNQKKIFQNIRVYELKEPMDSSMMFVSEFDREKLVSGNLITDGHPVYTGGDSLTFEATSAYAQKFVDLFKENSAYHSAKLQEFIKKVPGLYIETDDPIGMGGRINMFEVVIGLDEGYYLTGNYAELKLTADYKDKDGKVRKDVDTSFVFFFGPTDRSSTTTAQSAFNLAWQPSDALANGGSLANYEVEQTPYDATRKKVTYKGGEEMRIEGGVGLKPLISAHGLREMVRSYLHDDFLEKHPEASEAEIQQKISKVIINKATLVFPFKFPDDYQDMKLYPAVLSPTCKLSVSSTDSKGKAYTYTTFAGLTDASVESENQGDVNRSRMIYSPDVSHHVQSLLNLDESVVSDEKKLAEYDIWLLVMANETVVNKTSAAASSMNDYYNQLAYANYYNSLYGGGYGGYGYGGYGYGYGGYGYGGYGGYGYSNYYNYMMMASMYSSSSSSTTVSTELQLDKDRYYAGILYGTENPDEELRPYLKLIYSVIAE